MLSDPDRNLLKTNRLEDAIIVNVPETAPDTSNSVLALDIIGKPDVNDPPEIQADFDIFIDEIEVKIYSDRDNVNIRYTMDGSEPSAQSPLVQAPIRLSQTTVLSARCFRDSKAVSPAVKQTFTKVKPRSALQLNGLTAGLKYAYYEGEWDSLPDFKKLNPVKEGVVTNFNFSPRNQVEYFGFSYEGYIYIPQSGVYAFYTDSDDGSQLFIGEELVVDNDGLHSLHEEQGVIPLEKGYHPIRVTFFEKTGGDDLRVLIKGPGLEKQAVPENILFYKK